MSARVARIVRHPLKAIGREALDRVELTAGEWMPFDRLWAVAHERAKLEDGGWAKKANFLRGVTEPGLMAVTSVLDEATGRLRLTHPQAGEIEIDPADAGDFPVFLDWVGRIWPADYPAPTGFHAGNDGAHLTDVPDRWVAIGSLASCRALGQRMGQEIAPDRFRANFWIEGLAPWEEKDWVGRKLRLGQAEVTVRAEITRCKATMANPETGRRDADTLAALNALGHQEFGVYAEVTGGGLVAIEDAFEVLG